MNTSAILLIPVLHGFNGHSNHSLRKEAIILNKAPAAKRTFVTPKKHRCVYFGQNQASEDLGCTVQMLPTMEQDERDK